MNKRFLRHLQLILAALDLLSINAVFFTSQFLFRGQLSIDSYVQYTYFGFFLNLAWFLVTVLWGIYHEKYILSFEQFTKRSVHAFMYFFLLVIFYLYFFHQFIISQKFIIVVLASIPISLLTNRFLYLAISAYFKSKEYLINKVIVIGYNTLSKKLVSYLEEDGVNKEIIGFCEEYENVHELSNYPILSSIGDALNICKEYGVTEIYSTIAPEHNPNIYKLIEMADQDCIRFRIVPDITFFVNRQVHIDYLKEMPVISLRNEPLEDLGNRIRKRLFDVVVSSLVIIFILSWLIPVISILILLESRGPIFFRQPRNGKDNKIFNCLKFRSMYVNEKADEQQATKGDARITRIGRFLRRTSLDEFPQFLNVLQGDMSIVGPRPHMLKHTDDYSRKINQYMIRHFLKPGITGWAQIKGFRGETQTVYHMQKRVEHDLWYMENWSLMLDLKIMFLTVYNTVKGEENAF
ncbi:MAG: undecaprenyl-phosphate glucose phosphotransferase [Williamsia sp.]|nr:undecaprenyl-phosphate glucose phosphotransferase [Williamsia sp.]